MKTDKLETVRNWRDYAEGSASAPTIPLNSIADCIAEALGDDIADKFIREGF